MNSRHEMINLSLTVDKSESFDYFFYLKSFINMRSVIKTGLLPMDPRPSGAQRLQVYYAAISMFHGNLTFQQLKKFMFTILIPL